MNRLEQTFARLRAAAETGLVIYVTAGDPDLETTEALVLAVERAGADVVELGVPFTDPLADGPSVQASSERGLRSGTTLERILASVARLRQRTQIPLVLMTYYNPAYQYGLERLAPAAAAAGVDGFIMTDLPPEEAGEWKAAAAANELATIFLLAPTSPPERIRLATRLTTGFVYCISRTGVTGARAALPADLQALLARIRAETDQPVAVGFGISRPEHVRQVGEWADAAVVGSAVVDLVGKAGRAAPPLVGAFVGALKGGAGGRAGPNT